jgi:hypothetical protein
MSKLRHVTIDRLPSYDSFFAIEDEFLSDLYLMFGPVTCLKI